jgi:hypothetical protein
MSSDPYDLTAERLRILRAARDGRLRRNDAGRYIIAGAARPDRRVRAALTGSGLLGWPERVSGLVSLTPAGRSDLDQLERMDGRAELAVERHG